MRMFFKSIRNYILSLSMNAFYTTNESSTRHHISDTRYEQPRNEDYDVCPPSESDCPMITVKVTFPRPQPRLWHIHTLSYHHFNTMEMSNVHKFRSKVVPITDARVYGCCHQSNLLRWSSSGCMTLRQSRRQGKSRISEMKLPPSQPRPPRQPNLLSATKHSVDPVWCCTVVHKNCQPPAQNP